MPTSSLLCEALWPLRVGVKYLRSGCSEDSPFHIYFTPCLISDPLVVNQSSCRVASSACRILSSVSQKLLDGYFAERNGMLLLAESSGFNVHISKFRLSFSGVFPIFNDQTHRSFRTYNRAANISSPY
jgi:hypothetical protein